MTQQEMEDIARAMGQKCEGQQGFLVFEYQGVQLHMISDITHNRMRIISPVVEYRKLPEEQRDAMMMANFHLALDARYAVSDDIVYSAYIHPLEELTQAQLQSAIRQVSNLALSFGTEYSSGELVFGGNTTH